MQAGIEGLPSRQFGGTDLRVTPVCVGTAALGSMPETFAYEVAEEQALATLRAVFSSPITFVDTAAAYGDGESERRIGRVLRELGGLPAGRVLATKADRDLHTRDFSGDQIRRSIERSLALLGLDRLQVVYLHDPEHTTFEAAMSQSGPVEVLLDFKRQGLIQHVGIAGGPIQLLLRFVETGLFEAVITHNRYTLLNRTAEPLIDSAARRGLAVLNAAPYGSGLLAAGPDRYPRYAYQDAPAELVERTRQIARVCADFGVPLAAAALQFSLRDARITSTIVGISRTDHLEATLQLMAHPVPDELWRALEPFAAREGDPEQGRWS